METKRTVSAAQTKYGGKLACQEGVIKTLWCNVGDPGSIPGLGKSPGRGHGNPLQYSCLEDPMDRGAMIIIYT